MHQRRGGMATFAGCRRERLIRLTHTAKRHQRQSGNNASYICIPTPDG
ncbi:hypothetical protein KCP73_18695 [Salmonella enterica subsp. enterica]|nr:hypothetical protein KCP73_18695 [Salmonella enterica subsp. enterica]